MFCSIAPASRNLSLNVTYPRFPASLFFPISYLPRHHSQVVWPDSTIYWALGNFSKPVATISLPKSLTFLAFFVKVSKSLIFLVKSFLGNFYRHLATFYWSHCSLESTKARARTVSIFSVQFFVFPTLTLSLFLSLSLSLSLSLFTLSVCFSFGIALVVWRRLIYCARRPLRSIRRVSVTKIGEITTLKFVFKGDLFVNLE